MSAIPSRAPANPFGPAPLRRPNSIRRTSTLDTTWPDGIGHASRIRGHARDLLTLLAPADVRILAEDRTNILAAPDRVIAEIKASRRDDAVQQLVGARGGGHLRKTLARILPQELALGTPLHLLLDDFSGASLVAPWAWSQWAPDWMERMRARAAQTGPGASGRDRSREGVCTGLRAGSSAFGPDRASGPTTQNAAVVPPLNNPDDPLSWHELPLQEGAGMRRARRIDIWLDGVVRIDIGFQDSATSPTCGDRIAIHEYYVTATADPETFELLSIEVDPRVLPYAECPDAAPNASRMLGRKLAGFRLDVVEVLPGVLGCTHLNDVLRSMADVPQLAARLKEALAVEAA